jgi:hypothetical protein
MKKVFFSTILATMVAIGAQAQEYNWFAGGTVGFDYKGQKEGSSTTIFEVSPKVGFYLSERFGAGLMITLANRSTSSDSEWGSSKSNTFEWGFSPFVRYKLFSKGDFAILAESGIGVHGTSQKDGPSTFGFGIWAAPLLTYKLSPRLDLEVSSGLAKFDFSIDSHKSGDYKSTETTFGFGVDSRNFFSSPYQIGIIYKFKGPSIGKSKSTPATTKSTAPAKK